MVNSLAHGDLEFFVFTFRLVTSSPSRTKDPWLAACSCTRDSCLAFTCSAVACGGDHRVPHIIVAAKKKERCVLRPTKVFSPCLFVHSRHVVRKDHTTPASDQHQPQAWSQHHHPVGAMGSAHPDARKGRQQAGRMLSDTLASARTAHDSALVSRRWSLVSAGQQAGRSCSARTKARRTVRLSDPHARSDVRVFRIG